MLTSVDYFFGWLAGFGKKGTHNVNSDSEEIVVYTESPGRGSISSWTSTFFLSVGLSNSDVIEPTFSNLYHTL